MHKIIPLCVLTFTAIAISTFPYKWSIPRDKGGNDLVLLDIQTAPHPDIGAEYDPATDSIIIPKITILQFGTRDGQTSFFLRGALDAHDAHMLFRTREPVENQLRFDRADN